VVGPEYADRDGREFLTALAAAYQGDLASQQRGPGFLALVAATGVLGVDIAPLNLAVFAGWRAYVALSLWLIVFAGLMRRLLSTVISAVRSRATTGNQRAHRVI